MYGVTSKHGYNHDDAHMDQKVIKGNVTGPVPIPPLHPLRCFCQLEDIDGVHRPSPMTETCAPNQ